jgi:hypothetical protein
MLIVPIPCLFVWLRIVVRSRESEDHPGTWNLESQASCALDHSFYLIMFVVNEREIGLHLVWRTGLSDVPPDCVRCTREFQSELATFGNLGGRSAIIHRTVRCSTGLSGVPSGATVVYNGTGTVNSVHCTRRSQSRRQKAHRTVNSDCPVHHRTVRWPHLSELQRSEPNGLVMWLAHRTVSGGAPDCPVRHTTAASTNGHFGGWGYKYPPTTTLQCIQVFQPSNLIQEL